MTLRSLDDRMVPRAAEWLQRVAGRRLAGMPDELAADFPAPHHLGGRGLPKPNTPALPPKPSWGERLADVDREYTQRGLLRTVRELPQLGFVVLALLVVFNGMVFMDRKDVQSTGSASDVPTFAPEPSVSEVVGPAIGNRVAPYLVTRRNELSRRAAGTPDGQAVAVVSFADYQRIGDVTPFLKTVQPLRSFIRVPLPKEQTDFHEIPVRNFATDMTFGYRLIYAKKVTDAQSARTTAVDSDPAQKASYLADATKWYKEAELLKRDCPCIFAVLVQGSLRRLADLALNPGVRLVDLAPEGAPTQELKYRGLLPEETKVVTGLNEAG